MGTVTITVMVARIARGVMKLVAPVAAWAMACSREPVMELALCRTFINSYWSVLRFGLEELYRNVSNQAFQLATATKRAMVASTGLQRGRTIWVKILNSPAPSTRADSIRLSGKPLI